VLEDGLQFGWKPLDFQGLECFDSDLFLEQDFVWRSLVADYWFGFDYDFFPSFALYVVSEIVRVRF